MHVFEPWIYHLVMFVSIKNKSVCVEERWPGTENEQGNISNEKKKKWNQNINKNNNKKLK